MSDITRIIRLLDLLFSYKFIILFILVLLAIYFLVALFTWSFLKPVKYLGIPTIACGIVSVLVPFAADFALEAMLGDAYLVSLVTSTVTSYYLKAGIVLLIVGTLMLVLYYLVNKKLKMPKKVLEKSEA